MDDLEPAKRLRRAKARLAADPFDREWAMEVLEAERHLARSEGRPWAEVLDLGLIWDAVAPTPHLITDGHRATVLCHMAGPERPVLEIELSGSVSLRMGHPNDEAIRGHPLSGSGLQLHQAHRVHGSPWLEEHIRMNAVHPLHDDAVWRQLAHYVLVFHGEMVEALADSVSVRPVHGSLAQNLGRRASSFGAKHG